MFDSLRDMAVREANRIKYSFLFGSPVSIDAAERNNDFEWVLPVRICYQGPSLLTLNFSVSCRELMTAARFEQANPDSISGDLISGSSLADISDSQLVYYKLLHAFAFNFNNYRISQAFTDTNMRFWAKKSSRIMLSRIRDLEKSIVSLKQAAYAMEQAYDEFFNPARRGKKKYDFYCAYLAGLFCRFCRLRFYAHDYFSCIGCPAKACENESIVQKFLKYLLQLDKLELLDKNKLKAESANYMQTKLFIGFDGKKD